MMGGVEHEAEAAAAPAEMSEYERARLENIKRNAQKLRELGLASCAAGSTALGIKKSTPASSARKQRLARSPPPAARRSKRLRDTPRVSYADDGEAAAREREERRASNSSDDDDDDDSAEALLAAARAHAAESKARATEEAVAKCREQMEALRAQLSARAAPQDIADPFQAEAVRRWGDACRHLQLSSAAAKSESTAEQDNESEEETKDKGKDQDKAQDKASITAATSPWALYVQSRTSVMPPLPSPYALIQERVASDPWRLLITCVLISRVSSAPIKERCLEEFFAAFPTPTAVIAGNLHDAQPILRPLGMFAQRIAAVAAITQRFIEMPVFDVGLEPELKIRGIGRFGFESYLLFCRDAFITPEDRNLRAFAHWRQSLPTKKEEPDFDGQPAAAAQAPPLSDADLAALQDVKPTSDSLARAEQQHIR